MVARFLHPMRIEFALLYERISGSEIQAGPFDVKGHAANKYALWIKDIPGVLPRMGSRFVSHYEYSPLIISKELVERRKRVWKNTGSWELPDFR
ncbi:MAG: hypothetical protein M0C28_12315 [Candidatus Moduliflexus flocculans]|nr:hypothetical protein [Candidatus Moduliflexus flocculans]